MGRTFRPYQPDQLLVLPPSLQEWLPADHLAYFVSEVVDSLDLSGIYESYLAEWGGSSPDLCVKSDRKLLDASVKLRWRSPLAGAVRRPGNGGRPRPQ